MSNTYLCFDSRSGQILSVHHGGSTGQEAIAGTRSALKHIAHREKLSDDHLAALTVPSTSLGHGKRYKVDVVQKALIETDDPDGVGFSFGLAARSH